MWTVFGQCLSAEREHGNAEDCFAIAVTEHSDSRAAVYTYLAMLGAAFTDPRVQRGMYTL